MRRIIYFLLSTFYFLLPTLPAWAKGAKEPPPEDINKEWTLCVTQFDTSGLPPSRKLLGTTAVRTLLSALKTVDRRFRPGEERTYYLDYAASKSRTEAARALAAKRAERDNLIYRGDPAWKYKQNLKKINAEIEELEKKLAAIDDTLPGIAETPVFKFIESNELGLFPEPPKPGAEYTFCQSKKADALLTGSVTEFYGRLYITVRLYALFARAYIFEDSVIFSPENLSPALMELSGHLTAALSDAGSAAIGIHGVPRDAIVMIDDVYAGQGEIEMRKEVPGETTFAVHGEHYEPYTGTVNLHPGELADVYINMLPLDITSFKVDVPGKPGSAVFLGARYMGTAPLTLDLPANRFSYLSVETPDGETSTAIMKGRDLVRGKAEFVRAEETLNFTTKTPWPVGEDRVETARRKFYGAYGRFWIILPLVILSTAIAQQYIDAYNMSSTKNMDMYDRAKAAWYVGPIAWSVFGASLTEVFIRLGYYLYVSTPDAAPLNRLKAEPVKESGPRVTVFGIPLFKKRK